jgi:hypothetical protein
MNIQKEGEELYDILCYNRHKLPDFLQGKSYYELMDMIGYIEDMNTTNHSIWYKLCTGKINNKDKLVYIIPTQELINVIKILCNYYNILTIEEVNAGLGLLSYMINKNVSNIKITASDDGLYKYTTSEETYYPILKKDLVDIMLQYENNIYPPEVLIINTKNYNITDIIKLIIKKYIKIFIVFGQSLNSELKCEGYNYYRLPVLQLCSDDTKNYNIIDNLKTKLSVHLLIREDLPLLDTTIFGNNIYSCDPVTVNQLKMQDIYLSTGVNWIKKTNNNEKEMETIYKIYNIMGHIPEFISNTDTLVLWYKKKKKKMFPLNINTTEEMNNYYKTIVHLTPEKIIKLKEDKIIPYFLPNDYIEIYVWIIYSLPDDNKDSSWNSNIVTINDKFKELNKNKNKFGNLMNFLNTFF